MQDKNKFVHPYKNATKRIFWIVAGVSSLFSILLLALLFVLGSNHATPDSPVKSKDIIDLLSSAQQSQHNTTGLTSSQVGVMLPKGGWVQQTDKHGNLVQQYRCDALDPNPENLPTGWIKMTQPEVELILSDDRIVRITGNLGIANAPNRVLEAGEITGNVIISMFDAKVGETISPTSSPVVVMTTKQASFDNFIGEITCDHEVRIVSPRQTLVGKQLTVRFNDKEKRIEYVRLEELDYIELVPDRGVTRETITTPKQPKPSPSTSPTKHHIQATTIGDPIEYYIVSLFNNVQINQGRELEGRFAQANKLTIAFSNEQDSQVTTNPPIQSTTIATYGVPATIAAVSLASIQNNSTQVVRITCDGGLTMIPLVDPDLMPATPNDTRLELFGTAEMPVLLRDDRQGMEASGEFLRHHVLIDRSDLYGYPATLLVNDMVTTTEHLWISRNTGKGAAVGSGKMTDRVLQPTSTTLEWTDGVDFTFDSSNGDSAGGLKKVICKGSVSLTSEGSVITCDLLDITFENDGQGSSSPSLAKATGDVKATSDTQILFADVAHLTFTQETTTTVDGDAMFGGSKADKLKARGNVQVLLNDGGRAFCDVLDGHISQDTATLTGNVLIAYERMLMNRGETATLTLDQVSGKGKWEGPGQALFLEKMLDVKSKDRIERPIIQTDDQEAANYNNISMRANWKTSMRLDQKYNNGAGSLDLAGNVDVQSKQSPLERGRMTGKDLRLEFDFLENELESQPRHRELRRVIARNNAQIEHRLWDAQESDAPPVVYYMSGNHVEFDAYTHEAIVVGDGELVLRDPRAPNKGAHQSALAGRGTTRFTWDKKLTTTKITDLLYRIKMNGNVEMIHQGIDGEIGMLTSDSMIAFAKDPNPEIAKEEGVSQLTFRAMDLQQIHSLGNVYVATSTRKVDCDAFDYNLLTGIAKLTALDDKTVSIVTQGTSYPVRATSITWNMDPSIDTISIHGLQGAGTN